MPRLYKTIIISFPLLFVFVTNLTFLNVKSTSNKIFEQNKFSFNKIFKKRFLQEKLNSIRDTFETEFKKKYLKDVCSKSSSELRSYYKTGDISKINFEDKEIKSYNKDKENIKALIEFIKNYLEDPKLKTEEQSNKKDTIIKYLMHYLPLLIFFGIGILCIFGWIICWIFACCNCCFCQCFKKPNYKLPCFIITYTLLLLVIIFCIFGLVKSNKAFTGLFDIECSFLKIFEQIIDGEIKKDKPKWIGITGIYGIIDDLKNQINNLKENIPMDKFEKRSKIIKTKKDYFFKAMKEFDDDCYNEGKYLDGYTKNFDDVMLSLYKNKTYVLDIIKLVGHYDNKNNKYPDNSFLFSLNLEFSLLAETTDIFIKDLKNFFNKVMPKITKWVMSGLNDAQNTIDQVLKSFNNIINKIGEIILNISRYVDNYAKTLIISLFTFIILINITLGILLLLNYFHPSKIYKCNCCSKFLFKIFPHILWNALSLIII